MLRKSAHTFRAKMLRSRSLEENPKKKKGRIWGDRIKLLVLCVVI